VTGTVSVNLNGSSFDTVVSVHSDCQTSPMIICDDDCVLSLQSFVQFQGVAGTVYYIRISGYNGASGHYVLCVGDGVAICGHCGTETSYSGTPSTSFTPTQTPTNTQTQSPTHSGTHTASATRVTHSSTPSHSHSKTSTKTPTKP